MNLWALQCPRQPFVIEIITTATTLIFSWRVCHSRAHIWSITSWFKYQSTNEAGNYRPFISIEISFIWSQKCEMYFVPFMQTLTSSWIWFISTFIGVAAVETTSYMKYFLKFHLTTHAAEFSAQRKLHKAQSLNCVSAAVILIARGINRLLYSILILVFITDLSDYTVMSAMLVANNCSRLIEVASKTNKKIYLKW